MESLKNYIDSIFYAYEENEESIRLKNDILSHMEEEYEDLLRSGKNRNEAIGIIVEKFGSFDDLQDSLTLKGSGEDTILTEEDRVTIEEYKSFSNKFPILIAIGVAFCLMAAATFSLFENLFSDSVAIIIFFSFITIGVTIFIIAGVKKSNYINYFKSRGLTQYYDVDEYGYYHKENIEFKRKRQLLSSVLESVLWLSIVGIYLILGFVYGLWHPGWIIFIIGGIISGIIEVILEYIYRK